MLNKNDVEIAGNLTRDPETVPYDGGSVTKFTIAINDSAKRDAEPTYVEVVAFNKTGELCSNLLKKSSAVHVEGPLSIRNYTDKDGNKRKSFEVIVNEFTLLDLKEKADRAVMQTGFNLNKITLAGNLVRDPEIKTGKNGPFTIATIAVNGKRDKKDVMYVDLVSFDKTGANMALVLAAASNLRVEGRISIRSYKTAEGANRKSLEVIVDDFKAATRKPKAASESVSADVAPELDEVVL